MLYEAHKGVESECPENTLISFLTAAKQGYDVVELDLNFTKDKKCVVLHDDSINKTCRNTDGSQISEVINIKDITYAEALKFDAGIYKAEKFKNEKIPLFSETLKLCEKYNVALKIDNKIQKFSEEELEILFSICRSSNAEIGFTSNDIDFIKMLKYKMSNCRIHYDGIVDEEHLLQLKELHIDEKITVWLCVPSQKTAWVQVPVASKELCEKVKEKFSLGLWIIDNKEDFEKAVFYGGDIIETTGKIKPKREFKGFYDCHVHSEFSHDSKSKLSDIKKVAEEKNAMGFCITDHCDTEYCEKQDVATPVLNSAQNTEKYGCFSGVEIGEGTWFPEYAKKVVALYPFDEVIGSVHGVKFENYIEPFSLIDFSSFSQRQIDGYIKAYFEEMLYLVNNGDFDILPHLTNPIKYIAGKYNKQVKIENYYGIIRRILELIIKKNIALEVNTQLLDGNLDVFMPDENILKMYKEMGGYLITVGSDAHTPENLLHGFERVRETLKKLGFENLYYFEKRIPVQCGL